MRIQTTLRKSLLIAPAVALGVSLGGCDRLDTSKPDTGEVQEAIQQVYGSCPIWSVSDVEKDNGVPVQGRDIPLYAGQLSFTVSLNVTSDEAGNALLKQNAAACIYPLISGGLAQIHPSQNQRYRVSLQLLFARADSGWSALVPMPDNSAVINLYNRLGISVIAQVAPLTSTGGSTGAQEGTAADTDNPGVFHRLNLAVMSLLHIGGRRPDASNGTDNATSGVEPSAASGSSTTASSAIPSGSNALVADEASAAASSNSSETAETASASTASEPVASSSAAPVAIPASVPMVGAPVASASASESDAGADRAAIASKVQAAKLRLLMQKAQDAMNAAQYQSAVATAEAVLLLDPDNVPAQQLRAKALRLTQRTEVAVTRPVAPTPPLAVSPPAVLPPAQRPVARPLAEADLEGDWHGTYQCGPYIGSGSVSDPDAWTRHVTLSVRNGQATLVRQSESDATFKEVISGNILPDLSLHLGGTGQREGAKHPWSADFMGRFSGSVDAATFGASGTLSNWHREEFRACRLALAR